MYINTHSLPERLANEFDAHALLPTLKHARVQGLLHEHKSEVLELLIRHAAKLKRVRRRSALDIQRLRVCEFERARQSVELVYGK